MEEQKGTRLDAPGIAALVVAALTVLAVVRVGVEAVRRSTTILTPDLWETLVAAQAAGTGRQLVGMWSRLGMYHPGPAWFWWAGPFLRLSDGHPAGLALAAATLAAVAAAALFLAARSATDGPGALVVAAVLALGIGQLSVEGLATPWIATVIILPIAAGLVCTAVVIVKGSTWPAVAAVLLGSLVAQAHLGTLLIGLAIAITALVAWRNGDRRTEVSPPRWHGQVLFLAALLPWVPVVIDQAAGQGNAAVVVRYVAAGTVDERFVPEPARPSVDLTIGEALQQLASITSLAQERTAVWAGADQEAGREHEPSTASLVVAGGLLAAALAASRPDRWRRRSTDQLGSWICRVALMGLGFEVAVAVTVHNEFRPSLLVGAAGVGLALWTGAALCGLHVLRTLPWLKELPAQRRTMVLRTGTAVGALGAIVAVAGFASSAPGYQYEQPGDALTVEKIDALLDGGTVQVHLGSATALPAALALTAELEQGGTSVAVRSRYESHFADPQRNASVKDADADVWVIASNGRAPADCEPIGTYQAAQICLKGRT